MLVQGKRRKINRKGKYTNKSKRKYITFVTKQRNEYKGKQFSYHISLILVENLLCITIENLIEKNNGSELAISVVINFVTLKSDYICMLLEEKQLYKTSVNLKAFKCSTLTLNVQS